MIADILNSAPEDEKKDRRSERRSPVLTRNCLFREKLRFDGGEHGFLLCVGENAVDDVSADDLDRSVLDLGVLFLGHTSGHPCVDAGFQVGLDLTFESLDGVVGGRLEYSVLVHSRAGRRDLL